MREALAMLRQPRNQLWGFLLVIFGGLALVIPKVSHYYGDESLYTDAALRMVQTGDYWTPYYADGNKRFLKPVLTYWVLAASYHGLGISYLSSRLPFLLAGCLVILLTYRIALVFLPRPTEALLAALIAGSNIQLLILSIRSTPDVLVCLFLLLSLLGFARILFRADRSFAAYLLAYGGAGLAVQTKGLLGLCSVGFAFVFCALLRREKVEWRALLDWRAIALGCFLGGFWYVVAVRLHGREVVDQFFHDQVSEKTSFNPLTGLANLGTYFFAAIRHFLPWTLLVLAGMVADWPATVAFFRRYRKECWFLGGWFLFLVLLFSFGNMRRTRYLAASYPLLSVLFASLLAEYLNSARLERGFVRMLSWLAPVMLIGGVLLGLAAVRIDSRILAGSAAFLALAAGVFLVARNRSQWAYGLAVAGVPVLAFLVLEILWRPLFSISPAPALTAKLLNLNLPDHKVYVWNPSSSYPSQIRVMSGGRLHVETLEVPPSQWPTGFLGSVIVEDSWKKQVAATNFVFEPAAFTSRKWSGKDIRELLFHSRSSEVWARHRIPFYIARVARNEHPSEMGLGPDRSSR